MRTILESLIELDFESFSVGVYPSILFLLSDLIKFKMFTDFAVRLLECRYFKTFFPEVFSSCVSFLMVLFLHHND